MSADPNKELMDKLYTKLAEEADMPREYRGPSPVAMLMIALPKRDPEHAKHAVRFFADLGELYLGDKADWFREHNVGRFSSVIDDQGREYQFRSGRDNYETYKVGDAVNQRVFPDVLFEGVLLDGAYLGLHAKWEAGRQVEFDQKWVVIKDAKIVALVEPEYEPTEPKVLLDGEDIQAEVVAHRHGVVPTPLSAWTPKAFEDHARREAEAARKRREWDIEDYGLPNLQKLSRCTGRFMRTLMKEEAIYRRVLPPTPADAPADAPADNPLKVSVVESSP